MAEEFDPMAVRRPMAFKAKNTVDETIVTITLPDGTTTPPATLSDLKAAVSHVKRESGPGHSAEIHRFDSSGLAATVERARALLDDGDVLAAKILAGGAYLEGKAAAQFAGGFGAAGKRLVAKARQLQGDALLIETRAKIRIAAAYDAAQAEGRAAAQGRPKNIPDGNVFTQEEAGLSAREIHEARKLAAAEERTPGLVERAIEARLMAGLEPSRANLRAAVGTASATDAERGHNLYETPPEATRTLIAIEPFSAKVVEPACGRGAIARIFEAAGHTVILSDLVDYGTADAFGELQAIADFLESDGELDGDIVTNPPYGAFLNRFVAHALRRRPRKMALLLNLNFLCGFDDPDRNFAMDENPPARIHVFTRRLPMMHRDGWDGPEASSRMNTAWFVWERQEDGSYGRQTIVRRVDWKDFQPAAETDEEADDLYAAAVALVVEHGTASPAFLQRRFEIGYNRAMRLLEAMQKAGIVSAADGAGMREVISATASGAAA